MSELIISCEIWAQEFYTSDRMTIASMNSALGFMPIKYYFHKNVLIAIDSWYKFHS